MALNKETFQTRALTAVIFVIIMFAGLFWNRWSFLLLISIIHFGCWWEFIRLQEKIHQLLFHIYLKLGLMLTGFGLFLYLTSTDYQISGYSLSQNFSFIFSVAGFIMMIMGLFSQQKITGKAFSFLAIGWLYISVSLGLYVWFYRTLEINFQDSLLIFAGIVLPATILFCGWVNDTMAYIVGSFIGKTPFSKISPKKTWEGTIGGIVLCVVVIACIIPLIFFKRLDASSAIFFGITALLAAIAGTYGDLLESKWKRMAGVKDSGSIMPGHGGFLDRFDSLLLAAPVVWLWIQYLIAR